MSLITVTATTNELEIIKVSNLRYWFTYEDGSKDYKPMFNATVIYWSDGSTSIAEKPMDENGTRAFVLDIVDSHTLLWAWHDNHHKLLRITYNATIP